MFKRIKNKSVIHKWLLSYILILIIPLLIFLGSISQFLNVYKNEIKHSNSLILEQARIQMDQVLYEANSFVAEISIEPMITKLLTMEKRSDVTAYDLYDTTLILNRLLLTKNEEFQFLIHLLRPDITVSNLSYNSGSEYFNIYLSQTGLDKSTWDNLIQKKYSKPHYFAYEYVRPSGETRNRIAIISPLMVAKYPGMYANIVVFIDEDNLVEYRKEYADRDTFLIMDSTNQILYKSGDHITEQNVLDYSMLTSENNNINTVVGEENVIVSHIDSKASNWKYIIITSEKAYMEQLNILRNSMILSVVLCCVFGGLIIIYLLRHNYTPLKSVVQSIEEFNARTSENTMNEFQYITHIINQLQSEKKINSEIMKKQKSTLSAQMVLNLAENRDIANELDIPTLEKYDIRFQSELFLVLTFLVFEGEGPFPDDNEVIDDNEKNTMIRLIFENITQELFEERKIKTFFFHTGRLMGFIINPPAENERVINDIYETHEQITKSINKYFLVRFVSAISGIHRSWKSIPDAYSEALQVIEYNSMFNENKVIFYHEFVKMPMEENFYYPEETENHIVNNLKIGDAKVVCNTIKKVINLNIDNNSTPVTIRYLLVNIAGTIIKAINQFEKQKYPVPQVSFEPLLQENSITDMYSIIEENVHDVCNAIKKHRAEQSKPSGGDLYSQAVNIVKEHYSDKNLSVSLIADKLNVHLVHLSRTFMEYRGDSLSNYINSVRLNEAKKLILKGERLETVSEKVGFGSLRTFMRVFKKSEGITPGQYKKSMEKTN